MLDVNNLVELIKQASIEANEANEPCDYCYGKVTQTDPLRISVEQKLELSRAQLVLCRGVTNYRTQLTANVGGETETFYATVHNALQRGDEVVLLKKKGGQKYLVLDRVVSL